MRVKCGLDDSEHWHDISPTGMVIVLDAIRDGDLISIGTTGVSIACYKEAFTTERVSGALTRYGAKNIIRLDGNIYVTRRP